MAVGRNISVGVDVGSSQVKVIIAELDPKSEKDTPRIIGTGTAEAKGMRHGFVTNIKDAAKSIKAAISAAEKTAGVPVRKVLVSVGGIGLGAIISFGGVAVTKADNEITDLDVKRAIEDSEKELPDTYIRNRKIVHTIPLEYRIDGKKVSGRPQGLKGLRLEARVLYITCQAHHLSDLMLAFEEIDLEIVDVMAAPMAASLVTLGKTQKIAGCILANIGSETTSIIVYENNVPVSLETFQIGSNDITNDIALGLKVSLEEADLIKLGQGRVGDFPKKKLDEIIIARLSDIFDLIDDHLRKIDRSGLLPAGIILTGGGSGVANIEELSRIALHLPAKQSHLRLEGNTKNVLRDYEWAVAYGLVTYGLSDEENGMGGPKGPGIFGNPSWIIKWFKKFLP
jgi:cell division protein FtsA